MAEDRVYLFSDNEYFYEGNGNHIRRERLEETTGYAYDGRNRLTEISYPSALGGYTEKLGYDAAGNRIRRETEQEITTYRYDNCNRLQELHREYKNTETAMAQPSSAILTTGREICSARVRRSTAMTASDGWCVQRFRWNTGQLPIKRTSMLVLAMRHNPHIKIQSIIQ